MRHHTSNIVVMHEEPRIVIIGAGFAGIWAASGLAKSGARVLLIDRNNYHTFLPLLYQVAAAELQPEEIAYPVRGILRNIQNSNFMMDVVTEIDLSARIVTTAGQAIPYDYLIIATGSITDFFGVTGAAEHTFPLKTLEQGIAIRNHILTCFEFAVHQKERDLRRRTLTFSIVGGGATGVEFAGAIAELINGPLAKDYPEINFGDASIMLLEGSNRLLPGLPGSMGIYALRRLEKMGVKVRLNALVSMITPVEIKLEDGIIIPTETVVWTAGIRGPAENSRWGLPVAGGERVEVLSTLQIAGHPEVYAVGDLAFFATDGQALPMIAPVAVQQGLAAARNIVLQIKGRDPQPFRYRHRGTMVTIGRNAAAVNLAGLTFTGFPAWLLWLVVHLFNLIGFPNRFFVFIHWALDYFAYDRMVRLIFPVKKGNGEQAYRPPT